MAALSITTISAWLLLVQSSQLLHLGNSQQC